MLDICGWGNGYRCQIEGIAKLYRRNFERPIRLINKTMWPKPSTSIIEIGRVKILGFGFQLHWAGPNCWAVTKGLAWPGPNRLGLARLLALSRASQRDLLQLVYIIISKRGYELFLNGIWMTYAKFINGRFMNLAYVIHMPFKNSAILVEVVMMPARKTPKHSFLRPFRLS